MAAKQDRDVAGLVREGLAGVILAAGRSGNSDRVDAVIAAGQRELKRCGESRHRLVVAVPDEAKASLDDLCRTRCGLSTLVRGVCILLTTPSDRDSGAETENRVDG